MERPTLEQPKPPQKEALDENGLEKLSEEERKTWHLLVPAYRRSAINPETFTDYDPEIIKEDLGAVAKMEAKFKKDSNPIQAASERRGEILEALLNEVISLPATKWLGQNTESIVASRYDDIFNGVDLVTEIVQEEGFKHLALNIDITSSSGHLEEELLKIKKQILTNEPEDKLTKVKYFTSKRMRPKFIGGLSGIPKVLIGTDASAIRELSLLRIEHHTARKGAKLPQNSPEIQKSLMQKANESLRKLAKHRLQFLIIKEIEIQLEAFAQFARNNKKEEIAQEYESVLETVRQIKRSKLNPQDKKLLILLSPEDEEKNNNDKVFQALQSALKNFS